MRHLGAVLRNPVGVVRQALDDVNGLIFTGKTNVPDDAL